jgi:hypothetical protein
MNGYAFAREWREWWAAASWRQRGLPLAAGAGWLGALSLAGRLNPSQLLLVGAALGLAYAGPRARPLARLLWPLLFMLMLYDGQRWWIEAGRSRVRVAELLEADLRWFGVTTGGEMKTWPAWWQHHTHPVLDAISGVAYLSFVPGFLAMVLWWRFGLRQPTGAGRAAAGEAEAAMWAFFLMYAAGFATYLIYPAAPPWYVDHYGLGPAVLTAPPEAAGAVRFDRLIGWPVFARYYGQSTNVFGAFPSLHCALPMLGLCYALRLRSLRVAGALLLAAMTFAAVYLNHHYVVDVVGGCIYALATFALVESVRAWWHRRAASFYGARRLSSIR